MLRLTTRAFQTAFRGRNLFSRLPALARFCTEKTPAPKEQTPVSKLIKQLGEQITYEKQNAPKLTESLQYMKKQGWTVSNEGTLIEMKRTAGNKTIYVTFSARSPPSEEPSEEDTKKEEEEEIDDDFYEFTVYVQKDSAQNVVFADYITSKGQRNLMTLGFTKQFEKHKKTTKLERPSSIYGGPDLTTLDEALVRNFESYLQSLGVNEKVSSFVETYSIDAEHAFYVKWLDDLRKFIE